MEELTKLLTKIELTADDIIDAKQQIVNLDAKRHKTREAFNRLREQYQLNPRSVKKNWGIEKLREELHEKVNKLRELEGKPELAGFSLKPLNKEEILALRTGFKL